MLQKEIRESLELLVLHMLSEQPRHGYRLMKELEEMLGYPISPGTLYPLLKSLFRKGYVEIRISRRGGKTIKTYYITEAGEEKLRENRERLEKLLRFIKGLREFREAGGEELRRFLQELIRKLPEVDEEKKKKIIELTQHCLREYRKLLGLPG